MRCILLPLLLLASAPVFAQDAASTMIPGIGDEPVYQPLDPIRPSAPGVPPATQQPSFFPGQPGVAPEPVIGDLPQGSGTARAQGYTGDLYRQISPWELETLNSRNHPRQAGVKTLVHSRSNGVGTQSDDQAWLASWTRKLVALGVHQDKVRFEARRLTKDEFSRWASRQVWAVEEGLLSP